MGDDVVRQDSSLGCGHIVDRRHHLEPAVFHGDLDPEAARLSERRRGKARHGNENARYQLCEDVEFKTHGFIPCCPVQPVRAFRIKRGKGG